MGMIMKKCPIWPASIPYLSLSRGAKIGSREEYCSWQRTLARAAIANLGMLTNCHRVTASTAGSCEVTSIESRSSMSKLPPKVATCGKNRQKITERQQQMPPVTKKHPENAKVESKNPPISGPKMRPNPVMASIPPTINSFFSGNSFVPTA